MVTFNSLCATDIFQICRFALGQEQSEGTGWGAGGCHRKAKTEREGRRGRRRKSISPANENKWNQNKSGRGGEKEEWTVI